jgi:hypothetical protein
VFVRVDGRVSAGSSESHLSWMYGIVWMRAWNPAKRVQG